MYKCIHSKNWRWCLSFGTFPKTAKGKKPYETWNYVYHTGIRTWRDTSRNCFNIAFVVHLSRVIISFPLGKEMGECAG